MIETRRTTFTQLEISASGIVDKHDVRRAAEALGSALDGDGRARLLIDVSAIEDVTMKAFASDLGASARLAPKLARLQRVAVVGDASWLQSLARVRDTLLPRLQVRRFGSGELDRARDWLGSGAEGDASPGPAEPLPPPASDEAVAPASGGGTGDRAGRFEPRSIEGLLGAAFEAFTGHRRDARPGDRERSDSGDGAGAGPSADAGRDAGRDAGVPGLRVSDGDAPGLVLLELDGRIRGADIDAAAARLDSPAGGDVRLLARIVRFEGIEPAALVSPALWRLQREGLSRVSRAAIVTSVEWLGRMIESAARLQRVEVRTFGPNEEAAARAWLDG